MGDFFALYRLGLRQILLARQQQDFVSAVSHELKTPLTSIRMYAEMLREGWAGEDKKPGYYDFIFEESERLSRLIANVLQLARMERRDFVLELKPIAIGALIDMLRSKIHTQIERAGFAVEYRIYPACAEQSLRVDSDAFIQGLINLVDNAIKSSRAAIEHRLEISVACNSSSAIIGVRDYGPGVAKSQMKKIFQLFYRSGRVQIISTTHYIDTTLLGRTRTLFSRTPRKAVERDRSATRRMESDLAHQTRRRDQETRR